MNVIDAPAEFEREFLIERIPARLGRARVSARQCLVCCVTARPTFFAWISGIGRQAAKRKRDAAPSRTGRGSGNAVGGRGKQAE